MFMSNNKCDCTLNCDSDVVPITHIMSGLENSVEIFILAQRYRNYKFCLFSNLSAKIIYIFNCFSQTAVTVNGKIKLMIRHVM
jgi:hypothetical protein